VLDAECQELLKEYKKSGDLDMANHLIESLEAAHQHCWQKAKSKMDSSWSSRKSWAFNHQLGAA